MPTACARIAVALVAPILALAATVGSASPAQAVTWSVPRTVTTEIASLDDFEVQLMVAINDARVQHGLGRIRVFDSCADKMAEGWGARIASTGRFEHRDQSLVVRRCRANWAGETLIRGTALTPQNAVQAWMDSPGHRAIILNRKAVRAGVAVTRDSEGRMIGVLNVIRPLR